MRDYSFARVYYAVAGNGKTGVLDIIDEKDDLLRKRIFFLGGDTSFVKFGPLNESLGQILLQNGIISEDQLDEALDEEALTQKQLGQVILDKGWLSADKLSEMTRRQVEQKIISCFAYADGKFTFHEESVTQFKHEVQMFKVNPRWIVYKGVMEHYTLGMLEKELEHLRNKGLRLCSRFEEKVDGFQLTPEEKEFAKNIGEGKPFGQVIGGSGLGLTQSLKLIYVLLVTGLLEAADVKSLRSYQAEESGGVRRKPKTVEIPDDEEGAQPAAADEAGAQAADEPDPFADEGGADFASVVADHLSGQMEQGTPSQTTGEMVKSDQEGKELEAGQVSELLLSNRREAVEALLSNKTGPGAVKIGELMVDGGIIDGKQLQGALSHAREKGVSFLNALVELDVLDDEALHGFLSDYFNVPAVKLSDLDLDQDVASLLPQDLSMKYRAIPVNRTANTLVVAMADPTNIEAIDEIKFLTEYNIDVVVATENEIKEAIDRYHDSADMLDEVMQNFDDSDIETATYEDDFDIMAVEKDSDAAPVVKLVNQIMVDALQKGASDIHFEPYEAAFRVRYRIDGVLYHVLSPPFKLRNALVSRVKIMSKLDIAERRLPQDGRIALKIGKKKIDFRVSTLPTLYGEKLVLRILDKESLQLDLTVLGMEQQQIDDFRWSITQPYGMVLVTGPSGCGKTTTLYSALIELNKVTDNISTAEDPVEYYLEGINQVQMHDEIGLNFAFALRSFLRQDPDIIMVGEVRDFETAEISVKAALTGHIVLSTVHTNDAPGTINRLLNMGVEPFLVTAAVNSVASQRLVRKLCDMCKEPEELDKNHLLSVGVSPEDVDDFVAYKAVGCAACNERGYKGRLGIYEVMPLKGSLQEFILAGATPSELKKEAMRNGMRTMRQTGLDKVKQGETSLEEITRTTIPDYSGASGYEEIT